MSILSINKLAGSRSANYTIEGTEDHKISFIVVTDDVNDTDDIVKNAVLSNQGLTLGSAWTVGSYSKLKSITPTCTEESNANYFWKVDLNFGKVTEDQPEENPLDRPPEFSYGSTNEDEPVDFDIHGNLIINKAKLPLDPPVMRKAVKFTLNISRNEASFPSYAFSSINKTNSDVFYGQAVGTWLCLPIQATGPHKENDVEFYKVTYQLAYNSNGWKAEKLNQSLSELNDDGKTWTKILDDEDNEISEPVPIDENGKRLDADGTPIKLEFDIYESTSFSAFGLE